MVKNLAIIRGGGDIATGTIHRLSASGFQVIALESAQPTVIRRTVAAAQAVFDGETAVEGMRAVRAESAEDALRMSAAGLIPVLVDPPGDAIRELRPEIVVDAIIAKKNLGTHIGMARIVVGLGPGFTAGEDVHAVVETNRGHDLGRVIYEGRAAPDTGEPGTIGGHGAERVIRAPAAGVVRNLANIGDCVKKGQFISYVGETPVPAPLDGVLRGLINEGLTVGAGFKIGDVDPRSKRRYCFSISDKARSVAGGVLEAVLSLRRGV